MATAITTYKCDVCGAIYITEGEATGCEATHVTPTAITGSTYDTPKTPGATNYPSKIQITMADGSTAMYRV